MEKSFQVYYHPPSPWMPIKRNSPYCFPMTKMTQPQTIDTPKVEWEILGEGECEDPGVTWLLADDHQESEVIEAAVRVAGRLSNSEKRLILEVFSWFKAVGHLPFPERESKVQPYMGDHHREIMNRFEKAVIHECIRARQKSERQTARFVRT